MRVPPRQADVRLFALFALVAAMAFVARPLPAAADCDVSIGESAAGPGCMFPPWRVGSDEPGAPGTPGGPALGCEDEGTSYVPGVPADEQLEGDACAHAYERRTSGDEEYNARVGVDFEFEWHATPTDWSGEFTVTTETPFTRQVDEVQPIVEDVELGDRAE